MSRIFNQIASPSKIDEEKDFVTVTFSGMEQEVPVYQFNLERGRIKLHHKSHATIAAVTGKLMEHKGREISSTSHVFKWLGIAYEITYDFKKSSGMAELKDGVISFFPM